MQHKDKEAHEQYVMQLSPRQRGVLADMVMRSLRGSWRRPRDRANLLEVIAAVGDMEYYDGDQLQSEMDRYFKKVGRGYPDGRFWRRTYQDADVDVTVLPRMKVEEFAEHIPDDQTWDEWRIEKEFSDE